MPIYWRLGAVGSGLRGRGGMMIKITWDADILAAGLVRFVLAEDLGDPRDLAGSDKEVYLGQFFGELFRIPLRKAAGDDQFFNFSFLLETSDFEDGVKGFRLGCFDKTAGVHQHDICIGGLLPPF